MYKNKNTFNNKEYPLFLTEHQEYMFHEGGRHTPGYAYENTWTTTASF